MRKRHVFTPIAPETGEDYSHREIWEWCIRCGVLRLGKQYFNPSPFQKKAVVGERFVLRCR